MSRGRACRIGVVGAVLLAFATAIPSPQAAQAGPAEAASPTSITTVDPAAAGRLRVVQHLQVAVPELPADATFATATDILRSAGLEPGNFLCDANSGRPGAVVGRVTAFVPASGTRVPPGSRVDMRVIQSSRCTALILRPDIFVPRNGHPPTGATRPPPPPPPPPPPVPAANGHPANGHPANGAGPPPRPDIAPERPTSLPGPPAADSADRPTALPGPPSAATDSGIRRGVGAFVAPGDMLTERWYTVEFVAGPDQAALAEESEGLPLTRPKDIFIAATMRVSLLPDPNFEIRPLSESIQETGRDRTASWQWSVRPLRDGDHNLRARVEVLEQRGDGTLAIADSYTRRVAVRVKVGTWKGFLNALREASTLGDALGTLFRSWEKTLLALTALIGAAVGLWAAIRKLKPKG